MNIRHLITSITVLACIAIGCDLPKASVRRLGGTSGLVITCQPGKTGKTHDGCLTSYFFQASGNFTNAAHQPTNQWWYPTTNVMTVTCTNQNWEIIADSDFGLESCGKSSLTFTDSFYPQDTWKFTVRCSNNTPLPTNFPVSFTIYGLRTNGP